jgi:hypothetical protein
MNRIILWSINILTASYSSIGDRPRDFDRPDIFRVSLSHVRLLVQLTWDVYFSLVLLAHYFFSSHYNVQLTLIYI